jgi:hypothetical protein
MDIEKKWRKYEKRWKWRDFYFNKCLRRHGIVKYFHREPVMPHFAKKWIITSQKTNDYIYDKIMEGKPFMACRFGNTELQTIVGYLKVKYKGHIPESDEYLDRWFTRLGKDSGFFPVDYKYLERFVNTILDSAKNSDLLAMWHLNMEDFIIEEYAPQADLTFLFRLEPWLAKGRPWTAALKGKKVLIIHPFEKTIIEQYKKREQIYPNSEILPEFELKTLKAVQTLCGERDERFETWFDALDYMADEALKIDFDVALIGCGAYGMPLASKLKSAGKQAIHLGGATQLLFGIKGYRWENNYPSPIAKRFNDAWVRPSEEETPKDAKTVEKGCYW